MKRLLFALLLSLLCLVGSATAFAHTNNENIYLDTPNFNGVQIEQPDFNGVQIEHMDTLDFDGVQQAVTESGVELPSFRELVERALTGSLDLSPEGLLTNMLHTLFAEIYANGALMRNLLIVCVLSAVLKNITESFSGKTVGELGFYVCYVVLITMLFTAFQTAVTLTQRVVDSLANIMISGVPLITSLLVMSGSAGAPYIFSPMLVMSVNVISMFVAGFLAPCVVLGATIEIVNYITERDALKNMAKLVKDVCSWSLKVIAGVFTALFALQKITAPIIGGLAGKTAKSAAGAVPVVGDILTGAWDMVAVWSQAARSGVMLAFVITIVVVCAFPAIKLLALIFIFKITAALAAPVCDKRIVKCMDSVGGFCGLLLGCLVTVAVMFVLFTVILMAF